MSALSSQLTAGLDKLGICSTPEQQRAWLAYLADLAKWNRVFNLTAITDPQAMLIQHLFDSLSIAPYIQGQRIVDVGTGAGLPGIPLAILFADKAFTLLDSNGKKTRFLQQMRASLGLKSLEIVHDRVENFQPQPKFDQVIARAFAPLPKLLSLTRHLCADNGQFLLMQGQHPGEALTSLPDGVQCLATTKLTVPGLRAERHLLTLALQ